MESERERERDIRWTFGNGLDIAFFPFHFEYWTTLHGVPFSFFLNWYKGVVRNHVK